MKCVTVCLPAAGEHNTPEIRKSSKSRRDVIIIERDERLKIKP